MSLDLLLCATVIVVASAAAVTDARSGRIPNFVTLPPLLLGPLVLLGLGGVRAALWSIAGIGVSAIVPGLFYRATRGGAIGGGDLKLLCAIGALSGPVCGLEVELVAFFVLAVLALLKLAYHGRLLRVLKSSLSLLLNPFLPPSQRANLAPEALTAMRMGPAIAVAAVVVALAAHPSWFYRWFA